MSSALASEVSLAGRYRLVRRLASGGMGQVWRATDELLRRPVAVKLLRSEYAEDPAFLDRFRAEARRTAALSHPGIASVFDYGETEGTGAKGTTAYLVMELVEGEPLSVLLAREGRLTPAHALDVIAQAALALESAHRAGVVHRDVKPSNLLLRTDGVVKVTDFGIARAADEAPRTDAGMVVGTAAYLSPEQVACCPATPASDVYALGVVAYECLAGRRPFTGEHPVALALAHRRSPPPPLPDDVPHPVRELVARAMAKAPGARPPSAGTLGRQALVTRAALPEGRHPADAPGSARADGWLPVMSGWHPALGHARQPEVTSRPGGTGEPDGTERPTTTREPGGTREPTATDPEQDTGAWTPVPPLVTRVWSWPRSHRRLALTAILLLTVLLAGGVTAAARQRSLATAVPSVEGRPVSSAARELTRAGFDVRELSRPDRTVRAGVVLSQEPAAGTRLERGRLVTVVVSSGPAGVVVIPSRYLGKPLDPVLAALIRMGLRVSVTGGPAGSRPGTVTAINPSGALHEGDDVTVTVAPARAGAPDGWLAPTGTAGAAPDEERSRGMHRGWRVTAHRGR